MTDAGSTATGRLVNGSFALDEPLQARAASAGGTGSSAFAPLSTIAGSPLTLLTYSGPIANDSVTIGFRQHIAATQALRTGSYAKTLTFTLSTTTPEIERVQLVREPRERARRSRPGELGAG